eukprot:scaffold31_cov334-Pavlova_lutheri.AAC.56
MVTTATFLPSPSSTRTSTRACGAVDATIGIATVLQPRVGLWCSDTKGESTHPSVEKWRWRIRCEEFLLHVAGGGGRPANLVGRTFPRWCWRPRPIHNAEEARWRPMRPRGTRAPQIGCTLSLTSLPQASELRTTDDPHGAGSSYVGRQPSESTANLNKRRTWVQVSNLGKSKVSQCEVLVGVARRGAYTGDAIELVHPAF